jgi:hypothetical protein
MNEDKEVALRRRHVLRQFQKIQLCRQGHLRKATDLESGDTE